MGLVRLKGLEPARIAAREPKSRMSTNSITGAYHVFRSPGRESVFILHSFGENVNAAGQRKVPAEPEQLPGDRDFLLAVTASTVGLVPAGAAAFAAVTAAAVRAADALNAPLPRLDHIPGSGAHDGQQQGSHDKIGHLDSPFPFTPRPCRGGRRPDRCFGPHGSPAPPGCPP